MTEKPDLEALKALDAAATPGPWLAERGGEMMPEDERLIIADLGTTGRGFRSIRTVARTFDNAGPEQSLANAALIAAARTALPGLVEEVERLREFYEADLAVRTVGRLNSTEEQDARLDRACAALKGDQA